MVKKGDRQLAVAFLPVFGALMGCEETVSGLSAMEKYLLCYSCVAVVVLLWLLGKVKRRVKQRPLQQPRQQWQVEPPPVQAPPAKTAAPAAPVAPRKPPPVPAKAPEPAFGNPWWDIPRGTYIFIDTCVLMEASHDRVVAAWFDHLRKNAKEWDWYIVILNSVIRELDGLKNSTEEERSQASRAATNLLGDMQRKLGSRFIITGANRTPADDEFEQEMQEGDLLCTRDNNLALRINGVPGLRALGLADFPRIPRHMRRG